MTTNLCPKIPVTRVSPTVLSMVAVKKPPRMGAYHVGVESIEANVNLVVAVVDHSWRVVGYEDIDTGERSEGTLHPWLLEKIVALWFVFPCAAETSELDATNSVDAKMQVNDGSLEGGATVMVAFDGENVSALAAISGAKDGLIG
jgi:hypothetical protein